MAFLQCVYLISMAEDIHELQVGSKYESWELAKRAIEDFQLKTCSQFYVRDSKALVQAKRKQHQG